MTMTSWTPFRFFGPHDEMPQYSASIKDMMSRYASGKDYGQEDQYSHPYVSEPLLVEIETLPEKILPSLRAKRIMKDKDIDTEMNQWGRLPGGTPQRAQRIQKATDCLLDLANIERYIMSQVRALEQQKAALPKDRVAALEEENRVLKDRLAALEIIILGKKQE
jgi:hypothetical protein